MRCITALALLTLAGGAALAQHSHAPTRNASPSTAASQAAMATMHATWRSPKPAMPIATAWPT